MVQLTWILYNLLLVEISFSAGVPNPLPEVCYSGGVKTNPCEGNSCAPCWYQLSDGTWGCFDLLPSGQCQWGTNVGSQIAARGGGSISDNSNPSAPSGSPSNPNGRHKYSSTTYVISTVTVSDSCLSTRWNLLLLSASTLALLNH